jgi:GNAT superfamily N-acetyltransferase
VTDGAGPGTGGDASGPVGPDVWERRAGQRVVVRHRLPEGLFTDVVGTLVGVDRAVLVVATRSGDVRVPRADVVAGKVVPPRPSRPAPPHLAPSVTDLVAVMALHWNPADAVRLGGWWLRAFGGFTNRANCVVPLGDPGLPPDEALRTVHDWYAERGLPAQLSVARPVDGGVPAAPDEPAALALATVTSRGWRVVEGGSALVLVAPTAELRAAPPLADGLVLDVADAPDAGWRTTYRYKGEDLPEHAVPLLLSAPEQAFWSVRDGDRTVACARGSVGGGWAGVTAVEVDPAFRRRGLARVLLGAVARWAWSRGALSTYLQTAETNGPAQALYLSSGFVPHHRYDYVREP